MGLSSRSDVRTTAGRVDVAEGWYGGIKSRTIRSFICGTVDVPTARSVGSVGQRAMEEGVNATQAFEWGARFCWPMSRGVGEGV